MLFRRGRRATAAAPSPDGTETDERPVPHDHDRELEAVTSLSGALARAQEPEAIARTLLEECAALLGLDFAAVALISEDGEQATGLLALEDGEEADWWREVSIEFEREASAVASASFERAPVVIYDVAASGEVNRRLADKVGAKSAAFVPLVSDQRTLAVLVGATTRRPRVFT